MIRLEKKEFEHKGFLCAIMKMEYANLKDLKEKDLLLQGDKGQWLWLCIGLNQEQSSKIKIEDLHKIDFNVYKTLKNETHPELVKDLFKNNTQIHTLIHFDMNRFRFPKCEINQNHQLDEELCREYMDKLINDIEKKQEKQKQKEEQTPTKENPQKDFLKKLSKEQLERIRQKSKQKQKAKEQESKNKDFGREF